MSTGLELPAARRGADDSSSDSSDSDTDDLLKRSGKKKKNTPAVPKRRGGAAAGGATKTKGGADSDDESSDDADETATTKKKKGTWKFTVSLKEQFLRGKNMPMQHQLRSRNQIITCTIMDINGIKRSSEVTMLHLRCLDTMEWLMKTRQCCTKNIIM